MQDNLTRLSKVLAKALRHKPEFIGITIERLGAWTDVDRLITAMCEHGFSIDMPTLEQIVATDGKQRYSFTPDKRKIRANQGHSIDVVIDFREPEPPAVLYHGTAAKNTDSIMREGIKHMNRRYVHLSWDIPTAVKVGIRHGKPAVLAVDAAAMYADGYRFFLSDNSVWLTEYVPPKYISMADMK